MPPRKSTSSIPPTDNEDAGSPTSAAAAGTQMTEQQIKAQSDGVSVEDLLLPRAVTQRLAKSVLPPDTAIQKDALLAIQKAATVFVSYLSSHANEATLKRTLAPSDVLNALSELEFDSFKHQLERELDAHNEALADKKKALKDRKAATTQTESKDGDDVSVVPPAVGDVQKEKKDATTTTPPSSTLKGNKRIKRDSAGNEKVENSPNDDTDVDEDEIEEDDVEEEEAEDEEVEEEEEEDDETQEAEDLDRVEDLDGKMQADYDDSGSDDEDSGPAAQLRSTMGFG
ncbi:CBF/NF-Y family transcription factor, putative [Talaromyces stipitatus ATCC 10500]|uniref:DNA polymerase epsilon subunit D n=1 Tax=Talaromyces stipitatus (strain ATCC 10500 / CBS 375.48 / QM 6759 / NRRL 1006) TaxID=441959 RepID=B8LW69_TALSN|nr:CBF/NF-Y family transcription factor, putative [Talaromyces stipitatus ATCC 10500]EED24097.1 CBF/NF-Y family transcription factor, putative [Talaromyces stipitatus ATCC 10500]